VLFVGRLDRQKGFDVFLDVMARLDGVAEGLAVGDYLVGEADARVRVPDNVTLLGWRGRTEVQSLYAHADLLIMPSRWEGLPLVALEAMRANLPILATRAGGLAEVIEDGVTGHFFDLRDPAGAAAWIRSATREMLAGYGVAAGRRARGQLSGAGARPIPCARAPGPGRSVGRLAGA
jgi:glycosyltransferase involved in cell wall biosynthesis